MDDKEEIVLQNALQNLRLLVKEYALGQNRRTELLESLSGLSHNNEEFIDVFLKTVDGCAQENLTNAATTWLIQWLNTQKQQQLTDSTINRLLSWLQSVLPTAAASNVLVATGALLRTHPHFAAPYWDQLLQPQHKVMLYRLQCNVKSNEDFLVATVQFLDTTLALLEAPLTSAQVESCETIAKSLLNLVYAEIPPCVGLKNLALFLISSLTMLSKISVFCPEFAQVHISDLLGLAKSCMRFDVNNTDTDAATAMLTPPQKVHASQQSLYDSAAEEDGTTTTQNTRTSGGKVTKTRKPRVATKGLRQNQRLAAEDVNLTMGLNDLKTSDSDASETENSANISNRIAQERQRRSAKLRLAAITLLGVVVRAQERRVLYGYWHALLPNAATTTTTTATGDSSVTRDNILFVAQSDPNLRCRCTALQVTAQMLLGAKSFLSQAEFNSKHCPTSFLPFTQNLGYMVVAIYEVLTNILAAESSLPVLTQALKALALLVQATPFQQFEESAFTCRMVEEVRPLVYHRDATVQVAALLVMEFLVAVPDLTTQIADAVGMQRSANGNNKLLNGNRLNDEAVENIELLDDCLEEFLDSDDEQKHETIKEATVLAPQSEESVVASSWLLLRILKNIDKAPAASVRIASLQLLAAMATHFTLLTAHLDLVAFALKQALQDSCPPDVRLYAARCLDSCAYQIGNRLLDKRVTNVLELRNSEQFWAGMLDTTITHIRAESAKEDTHATFKVCLCDALSNIGVVIFERLPHATQMNLLSFLSGISSDDDAEETNVRAAAVRALAVYALFPSLRSNLVLVENVAGLTLRLAVDTNMLVRVKAFWAMGNVSDALLLNASAATSPQERISDDLLRRLIEAATTACNDNDKVRCNAVRSLGNMLRLLNEQQLSAVDTRIILQKAVQKLIDCLRGSAGNAKVKWNSCYAIGNLVRNHALFVATAHHSDLNWQSTLYPALCHIIVHHANFKVRINATAAILQIQERSYFGSHFVQFWTALLLAIEQSYQLDNFQEYNHRDNLQEQLCLALAHMLLCATLEDFIMLHKHLADRLEVTCNTWTRVTSRMVPEKAAPLLACATLLKERLTPDQQQMPNSDQRKAIAFIAHTFNIQ